MSVISVTVNGRTYQHDIAPRTLLVHYLREQLNLTGTHIGCDTSQCGACVVLLDGVSVKACTVLAVQANSAAITTIEGISTNGQLHPLQEGFWEKHGLQCGFCTPGMIMSAYDLLQRSPNPSEDEIRHGLEGNLCRCTGYQNIVKAVQYAAARASSHELGQDPSVRTDGDTPGEEFIEEVMSDEHGPRSPETTVGSDQAPVAG